VLVSGLGGGPASWGKSALALITGVALLGVLLSRPMTNLSGRLALI
jgi:hypothetical protein